MATEHDKPVDRDAWRRLLDGDGEGPPELTDARIRAKARQAITPRPGRWWLPASLAASLLLAVLLVQWQYDQPGAPAIMSESNYAVPPAEAPAPARWDEQATDQSLLDAPTTPAAERSVLRAGAAREQEFRQFAPAPPVVPPPQIDLSAAKESRAVSAAAPDSAPAATAPNPAAKREEDLGEVSVTGSRIRSGNLESATPVTQVTQADVTGTSQGITGGALMKSGEAVRPPEEWYAEIEKLRAAGKKKEARRELKKLEAAYPGWLEEYLKREPPKE